MKFTLLCFLPLLTLVGCEGKRETPKPLSVAIPGAATATPAPLLFADIFRRRPVPPGTDTNVDRVQTERAKHPDSPQANKAVGLAYYAAGGYEAAIQSLTGLADPEAQLYLGYAHQGLGEYELAEKSYVAAQKASTRGEALSALGLLRANQGKSKLAQETLLLAVKSLSSGKLRATAFAALGRLESDPAKARAWYDKTRKDDPENPWLQKLSK